MTPETLKALITAGIIAGIAAAGFTGGWLINGWRLGTALEHAERERDLVVAQGTVLSGSLQACNVGVETTRKVTDQVLQQGQRLVEMATKVAAGHQDAAARLDALLRSSTPTGAGCREAWAAILSSRQAKP